jgi:hypothetical protein
VSKNPIDASLLIWRVRLCTALLQMMRAATSSEATSNIGAQRRQRHFAEAREQQRLRESVPKTLRVRKPTSAAGSENPDRKLTVADVVALQRTASETMFRACGSRRFWVEQCRATKAILTACQRYSTHDSQSSSRTEIRPNSQVLYLTSVKSFSTPPLVGKVRPPSGMARFVDL